MVQNNFWQLPKEQVFSLLNSSEQGLSTVVAEQRLKANGLNEFPATKKRDAFSVLLAQFKSPFILILVVAAIIAFFLGDHTDAIIIFGILFLTAILGFVQEFKSEKALQQLRKLVSFNAKVLRDAKEAEIDVKQLVPGDLIFLEIGDIVPADARLLTVEDFSCNESTLTGESEATEKNSEALLLQKPLVQEQHNMVFMGTSIASGHALAIITGTGYNTQLGKTASFLHEHDSKSDFEKSLSRFGNFLIYVIVAMTVFIFIVNTLLGKNILESFLFALAIAVGITPEALPIIITIGLSRGAMQLTAKKVVVKRLSSIEDLGNIDVLCCDKTGTLTENEFSLHSYFDADGRQKHKLLAFALLCNSAVKTKKKFVGNTVDVALWHFAEKNFDLGFLQHFKKIEEIEFDFKRRRMSVIVENAFRELVCKGSFDSVLGASSTVNINGNNFPIATRKAELEKKFIELSNQGYRVIAVASKSIMAKEAYSIEDENNLCFLGFLSFFDPPKKGVTESIRSLQNLGVQLKIITGDNALVTQQVCKEVDFRIVEEKIVDGSSLSVMTAIQASDAIAKYNVFVRVSPEQKQQIVHELQKQGHIVGFLGDGINDATALKEADVGITVESAVDIARESADIILLKKSLIVIDDGIKEGRRTFGNMIKYIFNTVSANFGNMLTLSIASPFLPFFPLLPAQILLTNFISDGPLLMISTDKVDPEYLQKPRRWSIKTISRFMVFFGLISSVFDLLTMGFLFFVLRAQESLFQSGWFIESVVSEIIITFVIRTKRPFWKSNPSKWLLYSSIAAIILTVAIVYAPFNSLFNFVPLQADFLAIIFVILIAYFCITEIAKNFFFKHFEI